MAEDYELPERLVTEALLRDLNAGKVRIQALQEHRHVRCHCTAATAAVGACASAAAAITSTGKTHSGFEVPVMSVLCCFAATTAAVGM
jgi:hypothetical protein